MTRNSLHSVLVIDDHPLFRKGVVQLISQEDDFQLVGETATGREGIEVAKQHDPDLILLDLNMKEMDGIQVLKALKKEGLNSLIIMLTVSDAEQDLVDAIKGGADGYLLKDMEPEEIIAKMRQAARGDIVLNDALTGLLTKAMREDRPTIPRNTDPLTDRETQILGLISLGMSNKLIARKLFISDGTVKVHVKNMLRKLHLKSRLEAAVWAIENSQVTKGKGK